MKRVPLKLFATFVAIFFFCQVYANSYLLIRFTSGYVPTVTQFHGNYILTFRDTALTNLFKNYSITQYGKAFPSAHYFSHPNAEPLDRVYKVVTSNYDALYNALSAVHYVPIESFYVDNTPQLLFTPNDYANYPSCDFHGYTTTSASAALDLIGAPAAWDVSQGSASTVIAITEYGFTAGGHEDINNKIISNTLGTTTYPEHGLAVAGIAAAETGNTIGFSSIGNKCKLRLYFADYNSFMDAAIAGCKVINCSWLSGCSYVQYHQDVINMVTAAPYNVTIVAAAANGTSALATGQACPTYNPDGSVNDGNGLAYPASYDNVISVASICHSVNPPLLFPGPNNYKYAWKDRCELYIGYPQYTSTHNAKVDIAAPGFEMAILKPGNVYSCSGGANSGTSYASPMVTGLVGLILSVNANIPPADVEKIIKCSAKDIYEIPENFPAYLNTYGAGRLDAGAAMLLAQGWPGSITSSVNNAPPTDIRYSGLNSSGVWVQFDPVTGPPDGVYYTKIRLEAVTTAAPANIKWLVKATNPPHVINPPANQMNVLYGNPVIMESGVNFSSQCNFVTAVRVNSCYPSAYFEKDGRISTLCMHTRGVADDTETSANKEIVAHNNLNGSIYPNPATGKLNVFEPAASGPADIILINMQGAVVRTWKQQNIKTTPAVLNINGMVPGMYTIRIIMAASTKIEKLMIQ